MTQAVKPSKTHRDPAIGDRASLKNRRKRGIFGGGRSSLGHVPDRNMPCTMFSSSKPQILRVSLHVCGRAATTTIRSIWLRGSFPMKSARCSCGRSRFTAPTGCSTASCESCSCSASESVVPCNRAGRRGAGATPAESASGGRGRVVEREARQACCRRHRGGGECDLRGLQ